MRMTAGNALAWRIHSRVMGGRDGKDNGYVGVMRHYLARMMEGRLWKVVVDLE